MFGYNLKNFFTTWVFFLVFAVIIAASVQGTNSLTGSWNFWNGLGALGDSFGGGLSLLMLLVIVAAIGLVVLGLHHVTKTNYDKDTENRRRFHIFVGTALIIVAVIAMASVINAHLITIDKSFWSSVTIALGVIVVITVFTAALLSALRLRTKKVPAVRAVPPVASTSKSSSAS